MSFLKDTVDVAEPYADMLLSETAGNRGLLVWLEEYIKNNTSVSDLYVHIGPQRLKDLNRKGLHPAVMIVPDSDEFEPFSQVESENEIEVWLLSTVKGTSDYVFEEAIEYSGGLVDLLANEVPEHDRFNQRPIDCSVDYDWGQGDNEWLGISLVTLVYQFQRRLD